MKKTINLWQLTGFAVTSLAGTILHFLYEWFKKAADEGGLAKAQFKIGKMLYFGEGVKKNIAQGVNYVKLAFNNGYPTAMQFWNENQLWRYEQ